MHPPLATRPSACFSILIKRWTSCVSPPSAPEWKPSYISVKLTPCQHAGVQC